jgi:hypothetical protein
LNLYQGAPHCPRTIAVLWAWYDVYYY